MSQECPLPYTADSIEGKGIVWVDGKRVRYQSLPFRERMKTTGPYYETKEQKNAISSQLNGYYEIIYRVCILENIK